VEEELVCRRELGEGKGELYAGDAEEGEEIALWV
jgi:hypothetical protein